MWRARRGRAWAAFLFPYGNFCRIRETKGNCPRGDCGVIMSRLKIETKAP